MSDPLVIFDKVQKHFDKFVAVRELDFEIHEGDFLAIMGLSGYGKTTTLRMHAGLDTPPRGEIRLSGQAMNDVRPHEQDTLLVW
jgi:spermidine/putrescine transport system ATP-binding protein